MLQSHIIISNLAGATICLLMCSYTNRYLYQCVHFGRYYTEPHGFRSLVNAVNKLTFMPTLGDNNMTLTCVANKSQPEILEHVSVTLNVTCE